MHSIGEPLTGPMIIEKASVYGEMWISDKCTFSDGWLQIVCNTMALEGWVLVVVCREERELTMTEVNSHILLFLEFVHQLMF